jgi:hypothetical protein
VFFLGFLIQDYSFQGLNGIDFVMVDHYLWLSQAGVYTMAFIFGTLVIIPAEPWVKLHR